MFNISFNNLDIPSFVKVRAVDFSVLPSISHNFRQIAGGRGLLEAGTTIGGKNLQIKITIVPTAGWSLTDMARELAEWLRGNNFKVCPLIISDESNMTYMAKISNSVDISDLLYIGEGILDFIVPSGVARNNTRDVDVSLIDDLGKRTLLFVNSGTAPTRPILTWKPTIDLTMATQDFTCLETGAIVTLYGDFFSASTYTIDCVSKVIKRDGVVDMTTIRYGSEWITFPNRGAFTVEGGYSGTYSATASEYWL